jgi:hypothetical protein
LRLSVHDRFVILRMSALGRSSALFFSTRSSLLHAALLESVQIVHLGAVIHTVGHFLGLYGCPFIRACARYFMMDWFYCVTARGIVACVYIVTLLHHLCHRSVFRLQFVFFEYTHLIIRFIEEVCPAGLCASLTRFMEAVRPVRSLSCATARGFVACLYVSV